MTPLSTEPTRRLVGGAYRWPGFDKTEGENPSLRFLASPPALTIVLARQSVEAKDFLLFLRIGRKVGEEKVKE